MYARRFEFAPHEYGPVGTWWRDQPLPDDVVLHAAAGRPVIAHNAAFERVMWNTVLNMQVSWRDGLPPLTIRQMDCTMARACAIGLPADLERAAMVVAAPHQKDTTGGDVMKKMAVPRSVTFSSERAGKAYYAGVKTTCLRDGLDESVYQVGDNTADLMILTWLYSLDLRAILTSYCETDVLAECGVDEVVPALSASERETWELDQKINDVGIMLDVPFVKRLIDIVKLATAKADARMWTLTNGKVKKCSEAAKFRDWLAERGVEYLVPDGEGGLRGSVAKGAIDDLVISARTKGDAVAVEAIELRNAAAKSSTAKFRRGLEIVCETGRLHGQFRYHVANTGRWAAPGVQLQNLVRIDEGRDLPTIKVIVEIVENFEAQAAVELITAL